LKNTNNQTILAYEINAGDEKRIEMAGHGLGVREHEGGAI